MKKYKLSILCLLVLGLVGSSIEDPIGSRSNAGAHHQQQAGTQAPVNKEKQKVAVARMTTPRINTVRKVKSTAIGHRSHLATGVAVGATTSLR